MLRAPWQKDSETSSNLEELHKLNVRIIRVWCQILRGAVMTSTLSSKSTYSSTTEEENRRGCLLPSWELTHSEVPKLKTQVMKASGVISQECSTMIITDKWSQEVGVPTEPLTVTKEETNGKLLIVTQSKMVLCLTPIFAWLTTTIQCIKHAWLRTISTIENAKSYKTKVNQSMP